jgi:hypothetical protein
MARTTKGSLTIDTLEPELDRLINNSTYFRSVSEDLRNLAYKVFFVHEILERHLEMRILYKLFEEQLSIPGSESYCMTGTMHELIRKLMYTEMLTMVRGFKDGAPCGTLEKINSIRNDLWNPLSNGWKDKYSSKARKIEVLQLLIVGMRAMEEYMEKMRRKLGFDN